MRNWVADLRFALRGLRRNPAFAVGAVLVLALGIGANTAIFSIVNAVLLRPLPYQDPDQLMLVWHIPPAKSFPGLKYFAVSPANFLDWEKQSTAFDSMAIVGGRSFAFGGKDQPEEVMAAAVAPEFFTTMRARPLIGRTFTDEENRPGTNRFIILSYKFWRDHFGSDPSIVGRDIQLDSQPYRVTGVMPQWFLFPSWAKLWVPLGWTDQDRAIRSNHNYLAVGRLKNGVSVAQANAELSAISARLEQAYPADDKGWGATAIPLRENMVSDVRTALLVLLGAVGFVLLIACANVANLVLAKILGRRKEIAIRTAMGAGRAAIIRNILSETVLVSLAGGLIGLLLAKLSLGLSVKALADQLPRSTEIQLDAQVLVFTMLISVIVGVLAGLVPSVRFTGGDVTEALKQESRGSSDSGGKARNALVVCEVALSLVLLIGAGLMVRTLLQLESVRPGFDSSNVLTMSISVPREKFSGPSGEVNFFQEVLQRVRAVPGVESAGTIDDLPLSGGGSHQPFSIEGRPVVPLAEQPEVDVRLISPGYMRSMHIPILRGRDITDADAAGRPGVALISQALAKRYWPNDDPIGKHLTLTFSPDVRREVVGIVGDVKVDSLDETRPVDTIYTAFAQLTLSPGERWRSFGETLVVRTQGDPHNEVAGVTAAIHQVGPDVPVMEVLSMEDVIAKSMASQRFTLDLLAAFAALALLLAIVGIYGVLSYTVRRRVREIGIRMALGASRSDVLKLVIGDGMKPILIGIGVGLVVALALTGLVKSLVFGVRPTDPVTFASVAIILALVGVLANLVPAYRATRVEPVRTLRDE